MKLKFKRKRLLSLYIMLMLTGTVFVPTAYAEGDPMTTVNNLSTFIFGLIRPSA